MQRFRQTSSLLKILGQNTEKLDEAIKATDKSVDELRTARADAIEELKKNGLCFALIDKDTYKEIETDSLQ
jgi:hypothetical protein